MSDSYKLRGDALCKWVSESDTHQDAPIDKGPSADAEVSQGTPAKYPKDGSQD